MNNLISLNLNAGFFKPFLILGLIISFFSINIQIINATTSTLTIDFTNAPGSDGLLGTVDDVQLELGTSISEEYSSLGLHFSGPNVVDYCCELEFSLGALAMFGLLNIAFDYPQTEISFYIKAVIGSLGTSLPVITRDINGNTIDTFSLTSSDSVLDGRFMVSSVTPFSSIEFGATLPDSGGFYFDDFTFEIPKLVREVSMDIKPDNYNNKINSDSNGVIPVAILTTSDFDAGTVRVATLKFGPGEARATQSAMEDVDNDGDLDMILHFETAAVGFVCETNDAILLTGETLSGEKIHGVDSVSDVACK